MGFHEAYKSAVAVRKLKVIENRNFYMQVINI